MANVPAQADTAAGRRSFGALRVPAFRLFAAATLSLSLGVWIGSVGQMWLIQELTGSPFYLGLVNFFWGLPMMTLSLVGGVVADRFDRRTIMVVGRSLNTILLILMALLIYWGDVQVWQVLGFAFLQGTIMAFDLPARQSLIPMLVPRQDLMNAIAIHSSIWGSTNVIGPAVAGSLIALLGTSGCFFLAGGLSGVAALIFWRLRALPAATEAPVSPQEPRPSMLLGLQEGFQYLRGQRVIVGIMLMNVVPVVVGQAYISLMPAYAAGILHGDAVTYSTLLSAGGVGALLATGLIASLGDVSRKGLAVIMTGLAFTGGLLVLAGTGSFWPALILLALLGGTSMSFWTLSNTLVQGSVDDGVRARVTSIGQLTWGFQAFGSLLLGTIGNFFGVPAAIGIAGGLSLVWVIAIFVKFPEIRRA